MSTLQSTHAGGFCFFPRRRWTRRSTEAVRWPGPIASRVGTSARDSPLPPDRLGRGGRPGDGVSSASRRRRSGPIAVQQRRKPGPSPRGALNQRPGNSPVALDLVSG